MYRKIFFVFFVFAFSCKPNLKNPKPSSGSVNLSKFVAIGGTFMAGYQDWSLNKAGQTYSIPALLSTEFQKTGGGSLNQPLMPDNFGLGLDSKYWENVYFKTATLNFATDCKGVSSLMPIVNSFPYSSASTYLSHQGGGFQNLSVPYAKISDYNNSALGNTVFSVNANPYYARFSSNPGTSTMLSDAKAQQPTFFALWAGMEDIYDYASNGGYGKTILSSSLFSTKLDSVIQNFGIKGVIANIPDLASFPFYTTIPYNGMTISRRLKDSLNMLYFGDSLYSKNKAFHVGNNGFMIADQQDTSHPINGYRHLTNRDYILLTVPLDSMKCHYLGAFSVLPDRYVLDSAEVVVVEQAIANYNTVITAKAQQYNLALVDMNSYFKNVSSGIKWNGVNFNAQFVSGGFFSLDGYCPNQIGYSLIANEFIKAINTKYQSSIPWVNCTECSGVKFP
jgi:hypothetical protein